MSNPRDWRPEQPDEDPSAQWVLRDHEWSWGGNHRSNMTKFERVIRTFIKWSWVVAFVIVGLALLAR